MADDDYVHPVGAVAEHMAKATAKLMDEADDARAAGNFDLGAQLDDEARQHMKVASDLDQADQLYKQRHKL